MAIDPVSAIANAAGGLFNLIGSGLGFGAAKRAAKAGTQQAAIASAAQAQTAQTMLEIEEVKAQSSKQLVMYIAVGLIVFTIIFFLGKWAIGSGK